MKISYSPTKLPFQYDINSGTFTPLSQEKQKMDKTPEKEEYSERQNFSAEQQALLDKKPSPNAKPQHQVMTANPTPSQPHMDLTPRMGYAPIAEQLAKQAGVQAAVPNYQDFMKQREPINQAKAQYEATQGFPKDGMYKPSQDFTSVSMAPKFQSDGSQEFAASHQGLSNPSAIYDILQQGKALEEKFRNAAEGNYTPLTMGQIAQQRMDAIPQDMAWARQNPFSKEMGYQWADDKKLGELGWGADDITSMKARTEFHPQEIEELYRQGAIRAPYREYLAEQERLRQQAEAEAARVAQARAASYGGSYEPSYDEAPSVSYEPEVSTQRAMMHYQQPVYTAPKHESIWEGSAIGRFFNGLGGSGGSDNVRDYYASNPAGLI